MSPIAGYAKQSQVAVGGLIGKSFGPAILQAYLTTDVYEKNYGGHDTRLWGRVILPLWTAPTAPPVATPLYRKDKVFQSRSQQPRQIARLLDSFWWRYLAAFSL